MNNKENATTTTTNINDTTTTTTTMPAMTMTAADTCRRVAAIRALASDVDDPTHPYYQREPLARILAGEEQLETSRRLLQSTPSNNETKTVSPVVLRALVLDEMILQQAHEWNDADKEIAAKPLQIVILGAGMDTRAYRLSAAATTTTTTTKNQKQQLLKPWKWFEVDQEQVITLKEELLQQHLEAGNSGGVAQAPNGAAIARLKLDLAVELDQLFPALVQNGYDPQAHTLFVLEGLLYYIPLDGIQALLAELAKIVSSSSSSSSPSSPTTTQARVLLTMIDRKFLQHTRREAAAATARGETNNPWQNCDKIWKADLTDLLSAPAILGPWTMTSTTSVLDPAWMNRLIAADSDWKPFKSDFDADELIVQLELQSLREK